ncbi:hypothetical protein L208DRAFT_193574 [Tricholoma matsutake]|nr:hypothetical protein L208DRAFT_193574 [Tricholoma matsutake 945]
MSDQSFISSSHTSAHESAAGTATAVDKDESSRRHDPSIGSTGTPIKEVPGRGAASVVPQSQDPGDHAHHGMLASAKSAIHDATETIKHFLRSSPESKSRQTEGKSDKPSGRVVHKPPESGKQPILESSADETKPEDSPLPSKEIPGGSKIGVGSLPGHLSEVSVAKLPEERRQENLPSHETDHEQLGKTGGVGPLPGGPNESGVALLPEERAHPVESRLQTEDVKDVPSKSVTGDDSLPGTHSTTSVKKLAEELRQEVHPSPRIDKEQPQKAENAGPLSGDQSESGVSALEVEHDVRGQLLFIAYA